VSPLSQANRPFSLREIALAFEVPTLHLELLVARHAVDPACQIDGMKVYGGPQIRRIYALLRDQQEESPSPAVLA
jgi:hypothetical protein